MAARDSESESDIEELEGDEFTDRDEVAPYMFEPETRGEESGSDVDSEENIDRLGGTEWNWVSGGNKGIGLACIRALCKQLKPEDVVYLTARNPELGQKAVADLEKEGLKPRFHQLDISNKESVEALRDNLKKEHGGLDILINNAGIAFKVKDTTPPKDQARITCGVNYFDTARVFSVLSPILRAHARVVNVASLSGQFAWESIGDNVKNEFKKAVSEADVDAIVHQYIKLMASGKAQEHGFTPTTTYAFSKLALITLSRIQDREMEKDTSRPDINVYSCSPGYVATDMSSYKGDRTPDEGADTPVWLAMQPMGSSEGHGEFFRDRKILEILV